MSVGILLITHNNIGKVLLETALTNLHRKDSPAVAVAIPISFDCDPEQSFSACRQMLEEANRGQGVLVLTDMYGATPSNIAHRLSDGSEVRVVAGLNLPMLMRVLNYADRDLNELVEKAITGGKEGVVSAA